MRVAVCPGCSVRIKIPEGKSGRIACPKCGKVLQLKAAKSSSTASPGTSPKKQSPRPTVPAPATVDPLANPFSELDGLSAGELQQPATNWQAAAPYKAPRSMAKPRRGGIPDDYKRFVVRLSISVAAAAGLILLLTPFAFVSTNMALIPVVAAMLIAVGLIATGRIWFIVIGFQETILQGLLVLLVPYYWLYFLATRRGACLNAVTVIFASLVPAVMGLILISVFGPDQGRSGSSNRSMQLSRSQKANLNQKIQSAQQSSPAAQTLQTPTFEIFSSSLMKPDAAESAERALATLPGYVAGSFRMSSDKRSVSFQYRGDRSVAPQYAMLLPGEAGIMLRLTPTFAEAESAPE